MLAHVGCGSYASFLRCPCRLRLLGHIGHAGLSGKRLVVSLDNIPGMIIIRRLGSLPGALVMTRCGKRAGPAPDNGAAQSSLRETRASLTVQRREAQPLCHWGARRGPRRAGGPIARAAQRGPRKPPGAIASRVSPTCAQTCPISGKPEIGCAPSLFLREGKRDTGLPGAVKNTGGEALAKAVIPGRER